MRVRSAPARSLVAAIAAVLFAIVAAPGVAAASANFNSCSVVTRSVAASASDKRSPLVSWGTPQWRAGSLACSRTPRRRPR